MEQKLNPPRKVLAARNHWQHSSGNDTIDPRRMLVSNNVTAILADGTNVSITHIVVEGSSR